MFSRATEFFGNFRSAVSQNSFSGRVITGGAGLLLGTAYGSAIRLLSNLVLTRLLYPEAFGLMLIVNLTFVALGMLSDVGIRSAIISKRGELTDHYLDVVWTIMILRGVVLGIVAFAVAQPIALAYGEPQLFELIVIAGLAPVLGGFASPYPQVAEREVKVLRVAIWSACAQTIAIGVTLVWMWVSPSIWALAANGVVNAIAKLWLSYTMFPAKRMRIKWDSTIALELFHFGKWILLGTAFTFLGKQGDSLIISTVMPMQELGVFSIAMSFAKLIEMISEKLSWGLLFPVFSRIKSDPLADIVNRTKRLRLGIYAVCLPVVVVLVCFGQDLVDVLYDVRYERAGWMLQIISLGFGISVLSSTIVSVPLAYEHSKTHMGLQFARVIAVLGSMLVLGYAYGSVGMIWGIAVGQVIFYCVLLAATKKYGVVDLKLDLVVILLISLLAATGWTWHSNPMEMYQLPG